MIRFGIRAARPLRGRANSGLWNPIETRKALLIDVANQRFTTLGDTWTPGFVKVVDARSALSSFSTQECAAPRKKGGYRRRLASRRQETTVKYLLENPWRSVELTRRQRERG